MPDEQIIAAIASPVGAAGRIVLRIGGPGSHALLAMLGCARDSSASAIARCDLRLGELQFPAQAIFFDQGRGYTGEEAAELHLPGNPLLARMTLDHLLSRGARIAEPGEFTARAFFNGRLDLTEAEGVAASISATNAQELEAARRLQYGELSKRLHPVTQRLTSLLARLEAGIDFSEEEISFIDPRELSAAAGEAKMNLRRLLEESARFERLTHEPTIVLCGRPNAGKSTLLNALAGRQRAVVSPTPGTTRDILSAEILLPRGAVRVVDSAGLELPAREDAGPRHQIAIEMRNRALQAIETADIVVLLHASDDPERPEPLPRSAHLLVRSKCDISGAESDEALSISARSGCGMEQLVRRLDELAFGAAGGAEVALNARHVRHIEAAISELSRLEFGNIPGEELTAEHLRIALDELGKISGVVTPDEVLGRIFSSFCIGK